MSVDLQKYFIIDFDSTFTKVEALDILGEISLEKHPDKESALSQIREITNKGMDGTMDLQDSIKERLDILSANREHLGELIDYSLRPRTRIGKDQGCPIRLHQFFQVSVHFGTR